MQFLNIQIKKNDYLVPNISGSPGSTYSLDFHEAIEVNTS
jgi:hypothetical protein